MAFAHYAHHLFPLVLPASAGDEGIRIESRVDAKAMQLIFQWRISEHTYTHLSRYSQTPLSAHHPLMVNDCQKSLYTRFEYRWTLCRICPPAI